MFVVAPFMLRTNTLIKPTTPEQQHGLAQSSTVAAAVAAQPSSNVAIAATQKLNIQKSALLVKGLGHCRVIVAVRAAKVIVVLVITAVVVPDAVVFVDVNVAVAVVLV
jgi:hypothetical protein